MDLKSGESVWSLTTEPPKIYPALTEDIDCEVAIIGGGITGALVAFELTRASVDCVLIDAREIGRGSTSASTALLLYELDTPLYKLAKEIGEADAAACYKGCLAAIGKIEQLTIELGNRCDFVRRKSLYLAENDKDIPELEREFAIRRCQERQNTERGRS